MKREEIFKKPSVGRVFAGGAWFFLVTTVGGLLPWIVTILAGRPEVFGPKGVEFYTTSWALVAVCEIAGLGLGSAFVRLVAEAHERSEEEGRVVAANAAIFMMLLGIVISVAFFAITFALVGDPLDRIAFSFVGIAIPMLYLRDVLVSMVNVMHRFDYAGIASAGGFIGILGVGLPLIVLREQGYAPYLAATVPGYALCSLLIGLYYFRKVSPYSLGSLFDTTVYDGKILSTFLERALWIALTGLVSFGTTIQLSISLAKTLVPQREIAGLFGIAAGYGWVMLLITSMTGPLVPEVARAKERGDEKLVDEACVSISKFAFGVAPFLIVLYFVVGGLALYAINGPDYVKLGGEEVLRFFVAGMVIYAVGNVYGAMLVGLGKERISGKTFLASHLLLIGVSLGLSRIIPPVRAIGTALLISSLIPLVYLPAKLARIGIPLHLRLATKPVLVAVISFLVGWSLVPSPFVFQTSQQAFLPMIGWACAVIGLYFFLLAFLGYYDERDYRMIEDTVRGIHPALVPLSAILVRTLKFVSSLNPLR